jgi:putative nucleotidyltransferase with HDIG domain
MIKRVRIDQLRPGIFVHSFDCGWFKHPFWQNQILIKDEKMIDKIRARGIYEVLIDTTKGLDIYDRTPKDELRDALQAESFYEIDQEPLFTSRTPLKEELQKAGEIKKEARELIEKISHGVITGEKIDIESTSQVIDQILISLTRNKDALLSLINIRSRDEYTYLHSVNVGVLTTAFCKSLEMDTDIIKRYAAGALLHDIGKLKIDINLINKTSALSESEYNQMKKHVDYGYKILSESPGISEEIIEIVYQHHERQNGSGYPLGLKNGAIKTGGRIAAIVDVYDALTGDRSYSNQTSPALALRKLYEMGNDLLDPILVNQFIRFMGIYPVGSVVLLENGFLGIVVESGKRNLTEPIVRLVYDRKHNMPIAPRDLDLSEGIGKLHRIKSIENAGKWNIDPLSVIMAQ